MLYIPIKCFNFWWVYRNLKEAFFCVFYPFYILVVNRTICAYFIYCVFFSILLVCILCICVCMWSVKGVILTVFWEMKESITIDFLEKGAIVNSASNHQILKQYFTIFYWMTLVLYVYKSLFCIIENYEDCFENNDSKLFPYKML